VSGSYNTHSIYSASGAFGDVKGYEDYEMALVRNLDIWVMG
jgi:hypothetical protein